jgi:hypothetical protein
VRDNIPKNRKRTEIGLRDHKEEAKVVAGMQRKKMGLSIPNFIIGFKDDVDNVDNSNWINRKIEMDILCRLLFSRSSALYEALYNSGLINESFSYEYTLENDYAHLISGGESKSPEEVFRQIRKYISDNENVVKEEQFNRVKKNLIGSFISRFNNIEGLGNFINDYCIRGLNPFDYYEVLKDIKVEDILRRLDRLKAEQRWTISIID